MKQHESKNFIFLKIQIINHCNREIIFRIINKGLSRIVCFALLRLVEIKMTLSYKFIYKFLFLSSEYCCRNVNFERIRISCSIEFFVTCNNTLASWKLFIQDFERRKRKSVSQDREARELKQKRDTVIWV